MSCTVGTEGLKAEHQSIRGQFDRTNCAKMKIILSIACLLTQFVGLIRGQTWHEFEGHCYTVLNVRANFDTCSTTCREYGSYMIELDQDREIDFVRTLIEGRGDQYWVGLSYNNATQKYSWIRDGEEAASSLWHTNEPNFSGQCPRLTTEDQLGTSEDDLFKLADHLCSNSIRVICEKNADMLEAVMYREILSSSSNRCPMLLFPTRSKLQCARNCAKNKFCVGFTYDEETLACTPYKFDIDCPTTQILPVSLYVMEYARC